VRPRRPGVNALVDDTMFGIPGRANDTFIRRTSDRTRTREVFTSLFGVITTRPWV